MTVAPFPIAKAGDRLIQILPRMANRHGLIAGATGTGKTVSLRVLAEQFSQLGVPVFMADVKGDLSGMAKPGVMSDKLAQRLQDHGMTAPAFQAYPVVFWDVFGEQGHPVRTTMSEMGPLILSQLMELNDTQSGVLTVAFRVADDEGLLLLDLKDLRAMLQYIADNAGSLQTQYGNVSAASVGSIQRKLLALEEQGADKFFGEPALNLMDFIQTDAHNLGNINILAADKLMQSPKLYACFLLWMLSELFETLPEVGDMDKPKLVFFFDEAHLLFDDLAKPVQDKLEQVVRLIRSKGVGIYFISQSPLDIPDSILGQLGNRIQHALRAFTPRDQKAVNTAATTFRPNPGLDVAAAITEMGVGEALVSVLDEQGVPTPVERCWILPPASNFSPLSPVERAAVRSASVVAGVYENAIDRDSAYEYLTQRATQAQQDAVNAANQAAQQKADAAEAKAQEKLAAQQQREAQREAERQARERSKATQDILGAFAKSAARSLGSSTGRTLLRGILGSILR